MRTTLSTFFCFAMLLGCSVEHDEPSGDTTSGSQATPTGDSSSSASSDTSSSSNDSSGTSTSGSSNDSSSSTTTDDVGAVNFARLSSTLAGKCTPCHVPGGAASSYWDSSASAKIIALVNTTSPASSRLLQKGLGQLSHGGGPVWTTASTEYKIALRWVTDGASSQ